MSETQKIPEVQVGDTVVWTDMDLINHDCKVTKIKKDNVLDLEYIGSDPLTTVTGAYHKSVQHPDYGCFWDVK